MARILLAARNRYQGGAWRAGSDILGLVVRRGLTLADIGVAIGLGGAPGFTRLMWSLLFGISTLDPIAFAERGRVVELSGTHDLVISNSREVLEQLEAFVSSVPKRP